jgi:putative ABC transport system substrate-binding protein
MRRRDFVALLGSVMTCPIAWLDPARAQQPDRMRHVGVLMAHTEGDLEYQDYLTAFRGELNRLGWTEGGNIQIESRWGALEDAESRLRFANELIAMQPDVLVTQNTPPTASTLQQTSLASSIPQSIRQ